MRGRTRAEVLVREEAEDIKAKEVTGATQSSGYAGIDIRNTGRDAKAPSYFFFYVILVAIKLRANVT